MFKVTIFLKLRRSGVFIANFEHILPFSVFLLLTLNK